MVWFAWTCLVPNWRDVDPAAVPLQVQDAARRAAKALNREAPPSDEARRTGGANSRAGGSRAIPWMFIYIAFVLGTV